MPSQANKINAKEIPIIYKAFKDQSQYDNQDIVCLEYSDIEVYVAFCQHNFEFYIITIDVNTNYGYAPNIKVIKL